MWMSLMTSGVKIFERPSTVRCDGAVSSAAMPASLAYRTSLRSEGSRLS